MSSNTTCPIWGTPATLALEKYGRYVDSPRAGGRYFISGLAEVVLGNCDDRVKVRLTTWLVEQRRLGISCPEIDTETINDAEQQRDTDVSDRADGILRYLATRSEILGTRIAYRILVKLSDEIQLDDLYKSYFEILSHSGCVGYDDFLFLLNYLQKCGLIECSGTTNPIQKCALTVDGYARLAELEKTYTASPRAFVAMWFDPSMDEAWKHGFDPAIRNAGYQPVRIDQQQHLNKIDDEIIAEIRRARFVVADFTQGDKGARGGVYYEAGFAHGLAIPVIFTCQKDSLDNIHFDTRQYNHIVWTEPEELRSSLTSRIAAVIGDGPNKPPD